MSNLHQSAATKREKKPVSERQPQMLHVRIEGQLLRRLRMHCGASGKTQPEVVIEALENTLPIYRLVSQEEIAQGVAVSEESDTKARAIA